ncbi:nucleoside diphosphate kinase homolog 7 [Pelodytes ibericus]
MKQLIAAPREDLCADPATGICSGVPTVRYINPAVLNLCRDPFGGQTTLSQELDDPFTEKHIFPIVLGTLLYCLQAGLSLQVSVWHQARHQLVTGDTGAPGPAVQFPVHLAPGASHTTSIAAVGPRMAAPHQVAPPKAPLTTIQLPTNFQIPPVSTHGKLCSILGNSSVDEVENDSFMYLQDLKHAAMQKLVHQCSCSKGQLGILVLAGLGMELAMIAEFGGILGSSEIGYLYVPNVPRIIPDIGGTVSGPKSGAYSVDPSEEDRYVFIAEWYDPNAALQRRYQLIYYPKDASVEMFDVKNHRVFLRRTKYEELHKEDLFVGNKINVFSRLLHLIDYGDQYTARKVGSKKEKTLAMIKPDAVMKMGSVIDAIISTGFVIPKAKMVQLNRMEAIDFYSEHQSKSFFSDLINFMTSGPIVALEVIGDDAIASWRKLLGPTNSGIAKSESPKSIRARFGTDGTKNAAHGSDSIASAARLDLNRMFDNPYHTNKVELEFFFPSSGGRGPKNTAKFTDCSCCVIKPHAVSEGLTGKIISDILNEGFDITAMQIFTMEKANAEEFYEIYKGVVAEYNEMVNELCSGPCVALEICQADAPKRFREYCGPADPEIARHLRPRTLRARFGKTKIQNCVHCTDLPEDAVLEVQYFFKILDS